MIIVNQSAGIFFYSKATQRSLYLLRTDSKNTSWSIPGGKIGKKETLLEGLTRECSEEIEFDISKLKLVPIQKFVNNTFAYHTFFCTVEKEFIPNLNSEHCGYAWVGNDKYPKPLHPGLFTTVNIDVVVAKMQTLKNL
jgi:8-oxo-dGTP pyrophosphatase MutT (NUDIX family)